MKNINRLICFLFIALLLGSSASQAEDLRWDPRVTRGELPNGLQYFIQQNTEPEQRMELRLVINAGAVLEDDDQQGLAHFCEHMAFNGTENFKKLELVNYLESIGMNFGADLNAYTSFDETVYMLQLPMDDPEIVSKGFVILSDWAQGVLFEDQDIIDERGVVLEERRSRRGAQQRIRDVHFKKVFHDSKYADRMPIGTLPVLEGFAHDRLRDYYKDWYRPDLMAVIAVGDFEVEDTRKMIEQHFSGLKNPEPSRARDEFYVPDHPETLVSVVTDKEATLSSVSLYYKHPPTEMKTVADYRQSLVEGLFTGMLNRRLDEMRKKPDAAFLQGYSYKGGFVRNKSFFGLGAAVKDGGFLRGLEALLQEVERVRQFGFTETEFDRAKADLMSGVERAYKEKDTTFSKAYAGQYIQAFLRNQIEPGISAERELYDRLLGKIPLDEINELARKWIKDDSRVITMDGPEKTDVAMPNEEQILAVFDAAVNAELVGYVDEGANKPLLENEPEGGKVVKRSRNEALDVTTLTLSNGIEVMVKSTDFKEDQILMTAFSRGGDAHFPDSHYRSASVAAAVVAECGLGEFTSVQLQKKLAGKIVSVAPYITENSEGFKGSCSPGDLETLFKLVHMYFTGARQDADAFTSMQERMRASLTNRLKNPQAVYADLVQEVMSQGHPRRKAWTPEMVDEIDLVRAIVCFRDRFKDADDFTFLFVGNVEQKELETLAAKYLGDLPTVAGSEDFHDRNIRPPEGQIEREVRKGQEPKSLVTRMYGGDFEFNYENRYQLQSMIGVLKIRLREKLREELGGTYGVSVYPVTKHHPEERYAVHVSFGCGPDQVESMLKAVDEEVQLLMASPPDADYVEKVKESQIRGRETALRTNGFWLSTLQFYRWHEEDPETIFTLQEQVDALDAEDVQQAAKKYLGTPNVATFVLFPE